VVYNKCVNGAVISRRMLFGVGLALVGTFVSVFFGANSGGCHSLQQLEEFWTQNVLWWAYLSGSLALAAAALVTHRQYAQRYARSVASDVPPPPHYRLVMPLAFTLYSALGGGAQMIVHSKVFSELLALLFSRGETSMFTHWLLYLELVLVSGCGSENAGHEPATGRAAATSARGPPLPRTAAWLMMPLLRTAGWLPMPRVRVAPPKSCGPSS
jgi:hypothetical protein